MWCTLRHPCSVPTGPSPRPPSANPRPALPETARPSPGPPQHGLPRGIQGQRRGLHRTTPRPPGRRTLHRLVHPSPSSARERCIRHQPTRRSWCIRHHLSPKCGAQCATPAASTTHQTTKPPPTQRAARVTPAHRHRASRHARRRQPSRIPLLKHPPALQHHPSSPSQLASPLPSQPLRPTDRAPTTNPYPPADTRRTPM